MDIPELRKVKRSREYNSYERNLIIRVVYGYLFEGKSNREIDEQILNIDSGYSHGWQSMGILHYLGIHSKFKGIFQGQSIKDAIIELKKKDSSAYQDIAELLEAYDNMGKMSENRKRNYWLISANSKMYKHAEVFEARGYIDWKQKVKYQQGDLVYIYCTKPDMKVMFKTLVEKVNLKFSEITDDREYWIDIKVYEKAQSGTYCRLKLLNQVDTDKLSLENLKKHGLKVAPQGPMRLSGELVSYINKN